MPGNFILVIDEHFMILIQLLAKRKHTNIHVYDILSLDDIVTVVIPVHSVLE